MKVSVLIENTTNSELICEHGLSLFIEHKGKKYLLDTGQSDAFMMNAKKMQVPIQNVEYGVLSHGHYDHGGGFGTFFEENVSASVYAMRQITEEYFSGSGGNIHYIGVPKDILSKYEKRFVLMDSVVQIEEGVYLIPHNTKNLEKIGERTKLYRKKEGEMVPDDFSHELSLVFVTEKGLVIFNSCSHGGIQNIIDEVKAVLPDEKIYAFFGGLHMKGKRNGEEICTFSQEEIKNLANYLKQQNLQMLCTGHCTGKIGVEMLKKELGCVVIPMFTGKEICL